jgi:hypothetical protein
MPSTPRTSGLDMNVSSFRGHALVGVEDAARVEVVEVVGSVLAASALYLARRDAVRLRRCRFSGLVGLGLLRLGAADGAALTARATLKVSFILRRPSRNSSCVNGLRGTVERLSEVIYSSSGGDGSPRHHPADSASAMSRTCVDPALPGHARRMPRALPMSRRSSS